MAVVNCVRSAATTNVIHIVATKGAGVEGDPTREVNQYWSLEGELLAEKDDYADWSAQAILVDLGKALDLPPVDFGNPNLGANLIARVRGFVMQANSPQCSCTEDKPASDTPEKLFGDIYCPKCRKVMVESEIEAASIAGYSMPVLRGLISCPDKCITKKWYVEMLREHPLSITPSYLKSLTGKQREDGRKQIIQSLRMEKD